MTNEYMVLEGNLLMGSIVRPLSDGLSQKTGKITAPMPFAKKSFHN